MTTPAASPTPTSSPTQDWWHAMIRRELALKSQPEAAAGVDRMLRATPTSSTEPAAPGETLALSSSLGDVFVRLNAVTGQPMLWLIERLAEEGDASAPVDEMIKLAEEAAKPPADAERVHAAYETVGGSIIFRVRWEHKVDGLPVEGDYIETLLNSRLKKVFSVSRRWRNPEPGGATRWR